MAESTRANSRMTSQTELAPTPQSFSSTLVSGGMGSGTVKVNVSMLMGQSIKASSAGIRKMGLVL